MILKLITLSSLLKELHDVAPGASVEVAPTERVARAITGGVQAPGGGPGGRGLGSSQVLASLSAYGELSIISLS